MRRSKELARKLAISEECAKQLILDIKKIDDQQERDRQRLINSNKLPDRMTG